MAVDPVVSSTDKRTQALLRFAKVVAAGAVAVVIAWLAGPDVANVVGTQNAVLVGAVLTPLFSALEKYLTGPTKPVDAP